MKKLLATILALVMALGLCSVSWAEDGVTTAEALAKAVEAGGEIKLAGSFELSQILEIKDGKRVTIDLNGNTLTAKDNLATAIKVSNGYLIVKNTAATNGKVVATGEAFRLAGNNNPATWESTSTPAELVIEKGVEVESGKDCSVYLYGKGAKVDVYGKLVSKGIYATIQGQGSIDSKQNNSGTEIVIHEGAEVIHTGAAGAIYHPQVGTLTVMGGTITGGDVAVEIRRGTLNISGGTFTSNSDTFACMPNTSPTSGSTASGVAVAIAPHGAVGELGKEVKVNITGGTFNGIYGLYQADPDNRTEQGVNGVNIDIDVSNGKFVSTGTYTQGDTVYGAAVYSEDVTNFISGGTFSSDVSTYAADNTAVAEVKSNGQTTYAVGGAAIAAAANSGADVTVTKAGPVNGVNSGVSIKVKNDVKGVTINDTPAAAGATYTVPAKYYYTKPSTTTTPDATKGSPKTFDVGVGIYAVTALLSVTGMAWTAKKRH